jgi:hypothetical protein
MSTRQLWRHPVIAAAIVASVVCGALGSSFGTALLGETRSPGLVGSLVAGLGASLGLALLWAVPFAAVAVGRSVGSPRVVLFAAGTGQVRARVDQFERLALLGFAIAVFGMLGGIGAAVGQLAGGHGFGLGTLRLPGVTTVLALVASLVGSVALGVVLAAAFRRVTVAMLAYFGSLMVTALLVGGSYFVDSLRYPAAIAPWAPLFLVARRHVGARDLWLHTSMGIAVGATVMWLVVLAVLAIRQIREEVS